MNKKYAYICLSLLLYGIETICSEHIAPEVAYSSVAEYKPGKFTDQVTFVIDRLTEKSMRLHTFLLTQYEHYSKLDDNNCAQTIEIPVPKPIIKKSEPFDHLKKYKPDMNLTTQQKYIVAAAVACVAILGIVYKYKIFSSSKNVAITAKEVQKLVEGVVHNVSIPKQDQLNNIFEVLIKSGLENIVVYNDHLFEVNDLYKVEIKGRSVKVTRS